MEPYRLFRFCADFYRNGTVRGVFIAKQSEVDALRGKSLYLGEALGKNSEVTVDFSGAEITRIEVADLTVMELLAVCGHTVSGINPVLRFRDQAEEESDEDGGDGK